MPPLYRNPYEGVVVSKSITPQQWAAIIRGAGSAYGINPAFLASINKHEQSGTANFVINDWDSNAAKGTPSGGPFQFIKPTFSAFARQAKAANPAAWEGVEMDWRNPTAQALAASWAFSAGKGSHWATLKKALSDTGGKMKGGGRSTAPMPAQGAMDPSAGTSAPAAASGNKAAAISLIFGNDPIFAMAGQRAMQAATPAASPMTPAASPMGGAEGKGFFARRPGETGQQYLDRLLQKKFGLKHDPGNGQTTGGRHAAGSLHYQGLATDYGDARNPREKLTEAVKWVRQNKHNFVGGIAEAFAPGEAGHPHSMHVATARALRDKSDNPKARFYA